MGVMASQITSVSFVYSNICSDADQRKYQSCTSLAFVRGLHPLPMNSSHKGPVMRKIFPFDDVIMKGFERAPCSIPLYVWQMYPRGWSHERSFHFAVCGIERTSTQSSFWRRQNKANMMTSSNGNIFRVTGPLCGEFTGPGEFPTQRPVTRSFDVYFDLRLNKRLCKQSWGWWFETLLRPLWRQSNEDWQSLKQVSIVSKMCPGRLKPMHLVRGIDASWYLMHEVFVLSDKREALEPLLLTWFDFNPSMDK